MGSSLEFASGKLLAAREDDVLLLEINRPAVRNAIDLEVLDGLARALEDAHLEGVRALVICGAGDHFSAGADVSSIGAVGSLDEADRFIDRFQRSFSRLREIPLPTIAAIEGCALGAGLELALWCDIRVVAASAKLGVPESRIGALPAAGGLSLLPRLVGEGIALDLILTGEPVSGERAYQIGLASHLVEAGGARRCTLELARRCAAGAPLALAGGKKHVVDGAYGASSALDESRRAGAALIVSEDCGEGIRAFREKRAPIFRGR